MSWKGWHRLTTFLRSSLWIIPVGAVAVHALLSPLIHLLDARFGWAGMGLGVEGARALCNAVITLALSFVVFTFGSLLVAVQVAGGQYTPRIIATTLLCNNVIRYTVGLFVLSLLFAIKALNRTETTVPQLVVFLTGLLGFLCLVAFFYFIDYAARLLRPVSLAKYVGDAGLAVIDDVYRERLAGGNEAAPKEQPPGPVARTVLHQGTSAIVVGLNLPQLVAEAEKAKGVIEFAPQIGDFVGTEEPLFLLHGGAEAIDDATLNSCVIFGSERTMEQDPLFAFRILVDIAIKALSAAINDPTTAVLAIDQLQRLLGRAGRRNLLADQILDRAGQLRVICRTPDWEDFVHLSFTEIRFCGAGSIQIARRLRAMIVNLANTLPSIRHPALRQEIDHLDQMLEKIYVIPKDLALAEIPDTQGLGGSHEAAAVKWAE